MINLILTNATENNSRDRFFGSVVYDFTGPTDCSIKEAHVLSFTELNLKRFEFTFPRAVTY